MHSKSQTSGQNGMVGGWRMVLSGRGQTPNFDLALASFTHLCVPHELRLVNNALAAVCRTKWQNFHGKAK